MSLALSDGDAIALRIVRLDVENVKRLRALHVEPDGAPIVRVEGRNGAGKSSALDAIAYALGGKDLIPERPVRDGEQDARVTVDLGELIVERRWTKGGENTYLEVRSRDGSRHRTPQAILDSLTSRIAFDPLVFARQAPKEQAETLRHLAGLDLSAVDAEHERVYDERAEASRGLKQYEAALLQHPEAVAPEREEDVASLLRERDAIELRRRAIAAARLEAKAARSRAEDARLRMEKARQFLQEAENKHAAAETTSRTAEAEALAAGEEPDTATVTARIAAASEINDRVRRARARRELVARVANALDHVARFNAELAAVDAQRRAMIAAARWPVPGLGIEDGSVTWSGMPLAQASSAEQLRVSCAVGFALNPRAKVLLVREGSLLDVESMRLVGELAREHDGQVWVERVAEGDLAVVFEAANPFGTETKA